MEFQIAIADFRIQISDCRFQIADFRLHLKIVTLVSAVRLLEI